MPTLSRFYGMVIFMNYNDHQPPHFHARYQDQEVLVEIDTGVVQGKMARRALQMIFEWAEKYQNELRRNWELARVRKPLEPIPPLSEEANMFLHVTDVHLTKAYELQVTFSDGVVKEVDLAGELHGEVFEPLKDPEVFKQVKVNAETNTIEWPNGADFAPEFLYEIGREIKQVA